MSHDTLDYQHGSQGSQPPNGLDFDDGEYPNPEHFDWFWANVINAINNHAGALDGIDNDTDGVVDEAELAQVAAGLTQAVRDTLAADPHGNEAHTETYLTSVPDQRTQTRELRVETRTDDPSSPATGRLWIREDL